MDRPRIFQLGGRVKHMAHEIDVAGHDRSKRFSAQLR